MSQRFVETISQVHRERFSVSVPRLAKDKTPFGIFWGFKQPSSQEAKDWVQNLQNVGFNVTHVILAQENEALAEAFPRGGGYLSSYWMDFLGLAA